MRRKSSRGLKGTVMGLFGGRKDRRSGNDRHRHVDPRYRSPAYPGLVGRGKGERRHTEYENVHGHPTRRWVILIGAVVAVLLTYIFFFTCLIVSNKCPDQRGRKRTITFGYYQEDYNRNDAGAFVGKIGFG